MKGNDRTWKKMKQMSGNEARKEWKEMNRKWIEMEGNDGSEENGWKWKEMKRNGRNLQKIATDVRKWTELKWTGYREWSERNVRNWMELKRNEMKSTK